ncbi:MAG: hypothetical protein MI745_06650 [Pseudomonadales bacterium]|nr:hypothetical protein [Pseudomonadales bacterium]
MTQPSSDTSKNKSLIGLAVLVTALGGGNVAQSHTVAQEVRELRKEVQAIAKDVTLLNWRVTALEEQNHGQGT